MSEILTEEEQIRAIKDWWKNNGTQVLLTGCVVAASYFGYNWWQGNKESKLNEVGVAYESYIQAITEASSVAPASEAQIKTVEYLTDQLAEDFPSSHYAFLASLNTAALFVREENYEAAAEHLSWAKEQASAEADIQLVNYRYALVQAQLGNSDEALALLSQPNSQFLSIYAEARGDIAASSGDYSAAREAYTEAFDAGSTEDANRLRALEAKINSLTNGPLSVAQIAE